jgi:hypothetical protein
MHEETKQQLTSELTKRKITFKLQKEFTNLSQMGQECHSLNSFAKTHLISKNAI